MIKNIGKGGEGGNFLNRSLGRIKGFIGKAKNFIKKPNLGKIKSMATGGLGRLLRSRGVMSAIPAGIGFLASGGLENLGGVLPSLGQGCGMSGLVDMAVKSGMNKLESVVRPKLEKAVGSTATNLISSLGLKEQGTSLVSGAITSFVAGRSGMMSALVSSACNGEFCLFVFFCFRLLTRPLMLQLILCSF